MGRLAGNVEEDVAKRQDVSIGSTILATGGWPKVALTQYSSDVKEQREKRIFGFTHVPPIIETTISRDVDPDDDRSIHVSGATVALLPDESRGLDLGRLSREQRDYLKELRRESRERSERVRAEKAQRPFELTVVGPDGEPVPRAEVGVRMQPELTADRVTIGKLTYEQRYGNVVESDEAGRIVLKLPADAASLEANVEVPGFGPYVARWSSESHKNLIPPAFKAELERAWAVGGIVVDDEGKTVADATVHPHIEYKKRGDDRRQLSTGTSVNTNAEGKWQFASVPESMNEVTVSISHPDFMPMGIALKRDEFGLNEGSEPARTIELKHGITVTVKVVDEDGAPIEDAVIRTNNERRATSKSNGMYELAGCRTGMARIVASAAGKALDLQQVMVEKGMPPVEFVMKPGGHLRVVALDELGQPIPRTRIFIQEWRGHVDYFEFDHINQYADENGVWEWDEAPLDEFKADIAAPQRMQLSKRPLIARDEEYVFHPPQALVVSGTVVDAETKQPITEFRAIPGVRWENDPSVHWSQQESYAAVDGKFSVRKNDEQPAHLVRIEADGYRAAVSRDIKSDEESVTIDFALERGKNIAATVLMPDGNPAADAKVALGIGGSQIIVENGEIDDQSTFHAARLETDEAGKFKFPPQDTNYQLVITHPAGYAHVKATPDTTLDKIQLLAWARVEGTFRVGPNPAPNVTLELDRHWLNSYGENEPNIYSEHYATTGSDGSFVFERAIAGSGWLGRRMIFMVDDGATEVTSCKRVKFELAPGETKQIDVGGDGTPVAGKLIRAKGKEEVPWSFATVNSQIKLATLAPPPIPAGAQYDQKLLQIWFKAWQSTPEGGTWKAISDANERLRKSSPYFRASVDKDGTFRIDDMPSGDYMLSAGFDHRHSEGGQLKEHKFYVPDNGTPSFDEPVDLGALQLE